MYFIVGITSGVYVVAYYNRFMFDMAAKIL